METAARRRARPALWGALAVGLVLAVFVAVLATRRSAEARLAESPLLGKVAPEISGAAIDGREVSLQSLRGRWVVLNFFATWCVPCQREHPELERFVARHRRTDDARVLAVVWDDTVSRVRAYFRAHGGDWPVLADPGGKVALDYGVRGPPESYVVDPSGAVAAKFVGQVTAAGLDDLLARARARGA